MRAYHQYDEADSIASRDVSRILTGVGDDHVLAASRLATWRSGDAADCKSVHPGSIPGVASNLKGDARCQRSPPAASLLVAFNPA